MISGAFAQEEEASTFDLSPFTVDGSQDDGYQSLSTLAGTRLNTELRDVGSAISVLTEQFFEDTGATDANSVLAFAMNAEVAGVDGNFSGATVFANAVTNSGPRANPESSQRIRGLAEAQLTRGFFLTDIPFDSFNTTRVTINRGPNSLLFGLGTPGGIIDNAVKLASVSGDFGEIEVRFGERGSHRETIDYNKTIIDGRLGIRIAGLNETIEYEQRPTYEDDQRIYAAIHAVLLQNDGSDFLDPTILRANFESGSIEGTPPSIIPFQDNVSSWFSLPDNLDQIGQIANWAGRNYPIPGYFDSFIPKFTLDNRDGKLTAANILATTGKVAFPFFIQNPWIYTDPTASTPSVGLADPSIAGVQGRVRWNVGQAQNVPPGQGMGDVFMTDNDLAGTIAPGFRIPSVVDRNIYDNTKLFLPGKSNFSDRDFQAYNISLDQTFLEERAGISLAFDKQRYENYSYLPFSSDGGNLNIDVNEYLSSGHANPNLGRAFIGYTAGGNGEVPVRLTEREAMTATAFYRLNFTEGDHKWLGDHTFTAFFGSQEIDNTNRVYRTVHSDIPGNGTDVQSDVNHTVDLFRRGIPINIYLTDPLFGANSASEIGINQYFTGQLPQPGDVLTHLYNKWNPIWVSDTDRLLKTDYAVERFLTGGGRSRQKIDSEVISLQSRWFDGNLVGLIGYRTDEQESVAQITAPDYEAMTGVSNYRFDNGAYDPGALILRDSGDIETGDTVTWSLVGHIPEKWVSIAGSQLSVHYNESENFSTTGVRHDFDGNLLPSPSGTTKEYGVTLDTLGRRLSIRLNFYETDNTNATVTGSGITFPTHIGGPIGMMARYKEDELGLLASGLTPEEALQTTFQRSIDFWPEELKMDELLAAFPTYDALYGAMIDLIPEPQKSRYQGFTGGSSSPVWTANPNQSITQSFVSKGTELEMVGRLTDNWTISFNAAKQETVTSDTARVARRLIETVMDNLNNSYFFQYLTFAPITPGPGSVRDVWRDNVFRNLNVLLAQDGQVSQEQRRYRANLVTNYQFSEGRLQGFGLGGALRWQDKIATGYEIETGDDGVVFPRIDKPFWGPDELNGDIWLSYGRKIMKDRIDWKIQLNVRNLIGDKDYIPVVTNPDGRVAVVRNPNPEEVWLSNTFRF